MNSNADVDLIFKIAGIGIIVAVLNQLLARSGRDEQALMTTIAGLVIVLMMKRKLKSVRPQKTASNYVRTGSFMLTKDLDLYLYRTVTRTRRAETSSGSRSSGGGSRGGGRGGKF